VFLKPDTATAVSGFFLIEIHYCPEKSWKDIRDYLRWAPFGRFFTPLRYVQNDNALS